MGGRITIDSATLMNKGFEAIEAHHLFGVPFERIEVVVHPQSIVHSLIDLNDGATLAHLGHPDMRVPISYALHYPERADVDVPRLDLAAVGELSFEPPDLETFACLRLALEAGRAGGTAPCVLNAADEVAVAAFLEGKIGFTAIAAAIERVLEAMPALQPTHFEDLFAVDAEARRRTEEAGRGVGTGMNWLLIFLGFSLLIILHEAGHFFAAKATGMRVERFFLFFGPKIWSRSNAARPSTGSPRSRSGGYVKISGMNPEEELPPEVEDRGYYRQPVWKRIVVIGAGPAVNIALAFAIFSFVSSLSAQQITQSVGEVRRRLAGGQGARARRRDPRRRRQGLPGPRPRSAARTFREQVGVAQVRRQAGRRLRRRDAGDAAHQSRRADRGRSPSAPEYDAANERALIGFAYGSEPEDIGARRRRRPRRRHDLAGDRRRPPRLLPHLRIRTAQGNLRHRRGQRRRQPDDRRRRHPSLLLLALVSLSLGLINLLPFLPLDGGHIFWSLVEKLRGKPVSLQVMERADAQSASCSW